MKSRLCLPLLAVSVYICLQLAPTARGGGPLASSQPQQGRAQSSERATVTIPGPLRSFLRMAGISQKVSPEEVTPLLARKVFLRGYEGPQPKRRPTEFLILLSRYVQQARELGVQAGPQGILHVSGCEEAKPLLLVLGYRARPDCGQRSTYLETADPQRAFLTIDSGFPLPDLEKALQEGKPFSYPFPTSRVPVLFTESDWTAKGQDLLDTLLNEPAWARLYWALSRMDVQTRAALKQSPGLKKLLPFAAVLDFYGSHIRIRSGRVLVPGGSAAESGWKDL